MWCVLCVLEEGTLKDFASGTTVGVVGLTLAAGQERLYIHEAHVIWHRSPSIRILSVISVLLHRTLLRLKISVAALVIFIIQLVLAVGMI